MSVHPPDDTAADSEDGDDQQLVALETEDGVVIYDRQNHCAWIDADATTVVTERR